MTFRFLKIPVRIEPMFWLFLIFFTRLYQNISLQALLVGGIFFISLLIHEYGHALAAQRCGEAPEIVFEAFGGFTTYQGLRLSERQRFFITLSGPLLESLLIVIPYCLIKMPGLIQNPWIYYTLRYTMQLNILWVCFNLLPIEPLDGGKLARQILTRFFPSHAHKLTTFLAFFTIACALPYLVIHGYYLFAVILGLFGYEHYKRRPQNTTNAYSRYNQALNAAKHNDTDQAKRLLKTLLKSKDIATRTRAQETQAAILHKEGNISKAYSVLSQADQTHLTQGKCLLAKIAFTQKNYQLTASLAYDHYALSPTLETALLNAHAHALLSETSLAQGWLHTASQFPTFTPDTLEQYPELKELEHARPTSHN